VAAQRTYLKTCPNTMEYFSDVSRGISTSEQQKQVMEQVCFLAAKNLQPKAHGAEELRGLIDKIVNEDLFDKQGEPRTWEEAKRHLDAHTQKEWAKHGAGKSAEKAAILNIIYKTTRDFLMVEKELQKDDDKISPQFRDLKTLLGQDTPAFHILKEGEERDIHAEMRILNYIITKEVAKNGTGADILPPTYIGISKLCCKYCGAAISCVNKIQKGRASEAGSPTAEAAEKAGPVEDTASEIGKEEAGSIIEKAGDHALLFGWNTPAALRGRNEYGDAFRAIKLRLDSEKKQASRTQKDLDAKVDMEGDLPPFSDSQPSQDGLPQHTVTQALRAATDEQCIQELAVRLKGSGLMQIQPDLMSKLKTALQEAAEQRQSPNPSPPHVDDYERRDPSVSPAPPLDEDDKRGAGIWDLLDEDGGGNSPSPSTSPGSAAGGKEGLPRAGGWDNPRIRPRSSGSDGADDEQKLRKAKVDFLSLDPTQMVPVQQAQLTGSLGQLTPPGKTHGAGRARSPSVDR